MIYAVLLYQSTIETIKLYILRLRLIYLSWRRSINLVQHSATYRRNRIQFDCQARGEINNH